MSVVFTPRQRTFHRRHSRPCVAREGHTYLDLYYLLCYTTAVGGVDRTVQFWVMRNLWIHKSSNSSRRSYGGFSDTAAAVTRRVTDRW